MTTELDVLVVVVLYGGYSVEILADEVAQYAVAGAVQDTHAAHSDERGIINKVHDGLDSLITTHAADIDIGLECKLAVVDIVMSLLADICGGTYILNLDRLSSLQTVSLDYGGNLSESDRHIILVYGNHLTNLGLAGKTYRVTNLECALGR